MHPCTLCNPTPLHPTHIPTACSSPGTRSTSCPGALWAAEQPPRPTLSPVTRGQGAIITHSPHAAANIYRSPCAPVLGFGRTPCLPPGNVIGAAPSWGSSGGVRAAAVFLPRFLGQVLQQAQGTAGHTQVVPAPCCRPWGAPHGLPCTFWGAEKPYVQGGPHTLSMVLLSTQRAPHPHYLRSAPQKRSHFMGTNTDAPHKPLCQLGVAHSSP